MNLTLFLTAFIQIFVFLILSVMLLYATYRLTTIVLIKRYSFESANNEALLILNSGILFATGYLLAATIIPIQNVTRIVQGNSFIESIKYIVYFMGLGTGISFGITMITLYFFIKFIRNIQIQQEIAKNNIYISILLSIVVIVVALIVKDSYAAMLEALIPYPKIPNYF